MPEKDLRPFNKIDKDEHKRISKRGGKARTKAKSDGQKWRQIKQRLKKDATTDADAKWMLEKLESRDAWAFDIMSYIETLKKDVHPAQRVALGHLMIAGAKFHHGEKIKTENLNMNVSTTIEEWEKRFIESDNE